eukprot:TRINITY_DN2824_c0_g1_i2.p1 TRINITY_DN2824_c0_g1~~TRINITY_DN2824_c0_g1_i2.p1  ORF type:complete len:524 (-),score=74.34 TRINITY_DN2824_c0_g1_i2:207-1778(-)
MDQRIKQGWLFCAFSRISLAKKRWVVLYENAILFFLNESDSLLNPLPKDCIKFEINSDFSVKYQEKDLNNRHHRFRLQAPGVMIYFAAETKSIASDWISHLRIQANETLLNTFKFSSLIEPVSIQEITKIDENFFINVEKYHSFDDQEALIRSHITMVLKCADSHPLGKKTSEFLTYWITTYGTGQERNNSEAYFLDNQEMFHQYDEFHGIQIMNELYTREDMVFHKAIKLILVFRDYMTKLVSEYYKILNAKEFDLVLLFRQLVDEVIFSEIYDNIQTLYYRKYKDEDESCLTQILKFATITPAHLGIQEKLWLLEPGIKPPTPTPPPVQRRARILSNFRRFASSPCVGVQHDEDDSEHSPMQPPYSIPISLMKKMSHFQIPSDKINLLVEVSQAIIDSINTFHKHQQISIGGDDLIPLFTYVIIKSRGRNLYSESKLMEDFMDAEDEFSNRGYCIANFQTCLSVLTSYDREQLESSATDLLIPLMQKLPSEHIQLFESINYDDDPNLFGSHRRISLSTSNH